MHRNPRPSSAWSPKRRSWVPGASTGKLWSGSCEVRDYAAVTSPSKVTALSTALEPLIPPSARRLINPRVAALSTSPLHSLDIASGSQVLPDPPQAFGVIRPRRIRRQIDAPGSDPASAQYQPRSPGRELLRDLDDQVEDSFEGPDVVSSPIGGGGAIGRLLKGLFKSSRSSTSGPPGADAPTHRSRRGTRASRNIGLAPPALQETATGDPFALRGITYPEWDVHRARYRPDWCTVTPVDPPPSAVVTFNLPNVTEIRRSLSHIGVALERRHRQLQGIDIDIDAVVESHVQTMSGAIPEEAVYLDLVRARRDLGVLVLLDVSGSSSEPSTGSGTVHEHQRRAAASLTIALSEMGDRVALYAFRSQGRSAVQVERMKRFDDRMDAAVLRRLGASEPGAYTRLGAAIRHGTSLLARESGRLPAAFGRLVGRLCLRPRLRRWLRRSRCPPCVVRGEATRYRMRVSQHWSVDRCRQAAPSLRYCRSRQCLPIRGPAEGRRAPFPICSPLSRGTAAAIPTHHPRQ